MAVLRATLLWVHALIVSLLIAVGAYVSFKVLHDLPREEPPERPVLLIEGEGIERAFSHFLSFLSGGEEGLELVLEGALQSAFERTTGLDQDLATTLRKFEDSHFLLLIDGASGGTLSWLLALETPFPPEEVAALREDLHRGFLERSSRAVIRKRLLPSGSITTDVVAAPVLLRREEKALLNFRIITLVEAGRGDRFFTAERGRTLILGSDPQLLVQVVELLKEFP
jgi:hypothetical protein